MSATTVEPEAPTDGLPVFVANGTRRYRAVRVGKVALGIALAGWVAALCASLIGFAPLPLPVLSGSDDGQAVSAVRPQSPGPRHFERGIQRTPSDGGSGVKSSAAARRGGGTGGGAARSITGTSDTPARTQSPTAGVAQTASTTGSSSNQATSPQPTSISPAPSTDPPPPAPSPSPSPTPTTPPPTDSTSPPDQPDPTGSPDGSGGTTSGSSSESTRTTPTPDTSGSGRVPG